MLYLASDDAPRTKASAPDWCIACHTAISRKGQERRLGISVKFANVCDAVAQKPLDVFGAAVAETHPHNFWRMAEEPRALARV